MENRLLGLIDFKKVEILLEGFNKITGFVTAIIDLEGNILCKSGWRQICTEFHRIHPETAQKCKISDTDLANKKQERFKYNSYKCLNGLTDVVVPIIIKGEHIANLFSGQFFFEKPNREFFKKQAEKYGFDEKKYLEALDKVLVISEEKVKVALDFLLSMTQLISEMALQKLEQINLNKALKESEEKMRSIYRVAPAGIGVVINRVLKEVNPRICEMTGYTREELIDENSLMLYPSQEEYEFVGKEKYDQIKAKETGKVETRWQKKDGAIINILLASAPININDYSKGVTFTALDITERKQVEEALRQSEKHNAFLAQSAFELVELTSIQEIYKYTVQKLYELMEGNSIVALVEFNLSENRWKMQQVKGVGKKAVELSRLLGFDISQMEGDISTKYYEQISSGKLVELDFDLPGLFNNKLTAATGSTVKKMFSVEKMYCITFQYDEQILGNITIITNKKTKPVKTNLIEAFIQQVSNFVKKQKAEEALRQSEEMILSSQAVAHICSYSTTLDIDEIGKSQWVCSPEFYKIFGIDESYPHTIADWANFIHPDHREEMFAYHESVVKEKKSFNREYKIIRVNDGAERWVHGTGELEFDKEGKPVRMHGAIQDITERKQTEMIKQVPYNIARATITTKSLDELFDSVKNELNSIIDAKNFLIALYDEETGMLRANVDRDEKGEIPEWPAEKSLTGYVIKQNRPVLLRKNEILRLQEEGIIELFGTISEAWLGVPLNVNGKILGAVIIQNYNNPNVYDQTSIEIMELVAHELSMFIDRQRSEEKAGKLSRAIEQSSVSVVITNFDGVIEYVNPFFTELTGYSFKEAKGKNPRILKSGHHSKEFYQELWNTILSGNNWEGEMLNKKKSGELYWEKAVISPIVNHEGTITNFVGIKEDITERKKMFDDLLAAKEKAQESDKLKTAFLNNVSHEIRTPLNGILGFGTLLAETDASQEEKKEMLAIVQKSSDRLMNTMTDYIDMARIASGTMEVHKKEFRMQPFFEEVIEKTRQLCTNKKLSFEVVLQPEHDDLTLDSDPGLISKVLNTLLDNAVKFTKKGSITCGYSLKNGFIEFFVKDTGKGIAPEKLDIIFNMFTQEDPSNTRGHEGSGLGLSIAGGIVKLLGGTISVTSEKGKGSVFTFTIPYNKKEVAEKTAEKKKDNVSGKPLVLVAEDEESNYLYVEVVLKLAGCDYLLAKNGAEAVAFCKQHPGITLVLMDIKMPVMNGLEATRLIREFRPNLPIIATTAYAQTGDKHRFLAAGCDDYLAKPIGKERLLALLQKYMNI